MQHMCGTHAIHMQYLGHCHTFMMARTTTVQLQYKVMVLTRV